MADRCPCHLRIVIGAALVVLASPLNAGTIVVPDDVVTIQGAIDAAASGDSVLIRPGTYHEALVMVGKGVSLIGESGSDHTTLSGDGMFRILTLGAGVDTSSTIRGLHFESGRSTQGGAMDLTNGASPRVIECRFSGNRATTGAAVSLNGPLDVRFEDCFLTDNHALAASPGGESYGGAVYASGATALLFRRTEFASNSAQGFEGGPGGTVYLAQSRVCFEFCTIRDGLGLVGGIQSFLSHLVIEDCTFDSNFPGSLSSDFDSLEVTRCLFARDAIEPFVGVYLEGSSGTFAHNTIVSGEGTGLRYGGDLLIANNIVANNAGVGISCIVAGSGTLACNDVWNNGTNWGPQCDPSTGDNISLDPLFCDSAASDFRLSANSPCAPGASACGQIGALPVACPSVSVADAPRAIARLDPVWPNPAHTMVTLSFAITRAGTYALEIVDVLGRRQAVLAEEWMEPGRRSKVWLGARRPGRSITPGIFYAVLRGPAFRQVQRFVVID